MKKFVLASSETNSGHSVPPKAYFSIEEAGSIHDKVNALLDLSKDEAACIFCVEVNASISYIFADDNNTPIPDLDADEEFRSWELISVKVSFGQVVPYFVHKHSGEELSFTITLDDKNLLSIEI